MWVKNTSFVFPILVRCIFIKSFKNISSIFKVTSIQVRRISDDMQAKVKLTQPMCF